MCNLVTHILCKDSLLVQVVGINQMVSKEKDSYHSFLRILNSLRRGETHILGVLPLGSTRRSMTDSDPSEKIIKLQSHDQEIKAI